MSESHVGGSSVRWTSTDVMRPTQCSVGFLEVDFKMQELRERSVKPEELAKYLKGHPIPAVLGPDSRMYVTDHHHMGLALVKLANEWDESDKPAARNPFRSCCFQIVRDYSERTDLSMKQFFAKLEAHHLCHPFDGHGKRVGKLPKYLSDLVDDPYRSLAGLARKAGAFDKVDSPFTEFLWADYLRDKMDSRRICKEHLPEVIHQAVVLANDPAAAILPGFHGGKSLATLPNQAEITERLSKRHGADDVALGLPMITTKRNH
ncbi:MAG: ParB-like protein [bacterium]